MPFDFHIHPWTRAFIRKNPPIIKACRFFKLDTGKLPSTIDDLLREMDSSGVTGGVILGQDTHVTPNRSFRNYTLSNSYLLDVVKRSQGRLVPFAGVDPNSGVSVKELRHAVKDLGFKGLKVHGSANSVSINDRKKMFPLYRFCEEERIPILFHTGTTGLGNTEIRHSKPEMLDEVGQAFPDLRFVMAHFGWPWPEVAVAIALRNPNAYFDVSGWRPRYIPPTIFPYLNGILRDRFLFGTDYPMMRHKEWLDDFETNVRPRLKPGVAEMLLSKNAERLLMS